MPFVRLRRNVAIIGLSSAVPQGLTRAGGTLGAAQIATLGVLLRDLRQRGFCRVVLIHHPPLPGQNVPRKALTDAAALKETLLAEGAELVLHGHNHRFMKAQLGTAQIIGVPSASSTGAKGHPPAGWMLHHIQRKDSGWHIESAARQYDALSQAFRSIELEAVTPPG